MRIKQMNLFLLLSLILLCSCSHTPFESAQPISQPEYFLDNDLPFQPKRLWRMRLYWNHFPLDDKKANVVKEIYYIVSGKQERELLEQQIQQQGGDEKFLRWLENEIHPIGSMEKTEVTRIERHSEYWMAILTFKALKEIKKSEWFSVQSLIVPDPLLLDLSEGCDSRNWDSVGVVGGSQSVGVEVVLESRFVDPKAVRWQKQEGAYRYQGTELEDKVSADYRTGQVYWKSWSVSQGRRIAYRGVLRTNDIFSRCPLPPEIYKQVGLFKKAQNRSVGIEWGE